MFYVGFLILGVWEFKILTKSDTKVNKDGKYCQMSTKNTIEISGTRMEAFLCFMKYLSLIFRKIRWNWYIQILSSLRCYNICFYIKCQGWMTLWKLRIGANCYICGHYTALRDHVRLSLFAHARTHTHTHKVTTFKHKS